MDDPFQTPPQHATMPSIDEFVVITKKTLISLLLDLPIQELSVRKNILSDDDDSDSATLNFIPELGRALTHAHITPSAPKTSPKKRLYASVNRRHSEPFLPPEPLSPTKPRTPPDKVPHAALAQSPIDVDDSISSLQTQISPTGTQNRVSSRRQQMIKMAKAMMAKADGISPDIGRMLTLTATNLDNTKREPIMPRSVLDSIQWDHPPSLPPSRPW